MKTQIKEYNRAGWKGFKFDFVCDDKYLTNQKNPAAAARWFLSFTGRAALTITQVSRYPSRDF
jgi:hypothetical protein